MKKISAGSVEDTLLLLDIVKEKQQVENRKLKVSFQSKNCSSKI